MADFGDAPDTGGPPAAYPSVNGGRDPDDSEILDNIQVDTINHGGVRALAAEALDREHEQETADVLRTMSELDTGDGIYWRISRIGHEDPSMNGHMGTWPDARVTLDNIKDNFGGGIYRCKGFRSAGGYAGHKTVRIAGDAVRKAKANVEQSATNNAGFDVQGFLAQMEARDERRRRDERELQERRDAQREKYILTLGPALLTAMGGLFNRPQLDVGALAAAMRPLPGPDPLQMIAALKSLAPEPVPAGKDPMQTAITLFELLADKAGANSGRSEWLDVVKEGVKVLGPSVGGAIEQTIVQARENATAAQQNGAAHGSPQNAQVPAALPAPSANAHIQQAASEAGMLDLLPHLSWLKTQLAKLAGAAHRNRDPELYAAMFLEELPNGLTPQRVLELLSRSDWLAQLARFEPSIDDTIAPWWNQLRECLFAMIHEAAAAATAPKKSALELRAGEVERPQAMPSLTGE
jgi:hypothetical protein